MSIVQSIMTLGAEGVVIDIECHMTNGLPAIVIVGLGNKAVDESKERVRSAYASTRVTLPRKRITINLAPADIPKESTSLDLAIAIAIMAAGKQVNRTPGPGQAVIGELGLEGSVRPVRGLIGKILAGKKLGIHTFFVPAANIAQALLVPDITVHPVQTLRDFYLSLNNQMQLPTHTSNTRISLPRQPEQAPSGATLSNIIGQEPAKRALEIAAAGGHNVLLSGPPGTGKSMLARALPSILPPMDHHEILEVTHLHSLANHNYEELIFQRPFRSPHHSASHVSIVGGGTNAHPGEITLSHRGVFFLDEMPEFNRMTLEALRQPLEDGVITVARAKQSVNYPADFILVATANPCPCGYYGTDKECQCSPHHIQRYKQKLSGPILDRIDLHVEVHSVEHAKLLSAPRQTDDTAVRNRVVQARNMQRKRFKNIKKLNALMHSTDIRTQAHLQQDAQDILTTAAEKLQLSARSYMRLIKVARTIADLERSPAICPRHITEALQYRTLQTFDT